MDYQTACFSDKKELCDKLRIMNYLLFLIIITTFGYILYTMIRDLYKED